MLKSFQLFKTGGPIAVISMLQKALQLINTMSSVSIFKWATLLLQNSLKQPYAWWGYTHWTYLFLQQMIMN